MENSFPRVITLLRTERKLTQKKAAEALGISQALLSHYEKGIRECGLDFLVKAADYYGVSCDYLLGRTPYRNGAILTVDDFPEVDSNAQDKRQPGAAVALLNKRQIVNSLNILYDLLRKQGNNALTSEASNYIMLAVYRVFHCVYSINQKNAKSYFSIDRALANGYCSAAMLSSQTRLQALAEGHVVGEQKGVENPDRLILSDESLLADYPQYAPSLANLIRNSESKMNKM